jgi:1-acyl-sn-glycerol-3-phosphate acyltransferase
MVQAIVNHPLAGPVVPAWPRTPAVQSIRRGLQAPTFALLRRMAPAPVTGRHWLADLDGPAIFVANHASHLDTPVLLAGLPALWREQVAVAAAADYFAPGSWQGVGAELVFNTFPVSRTEARSTLTACAGLLAQGWSLLIYPEGTRSPDGTSGAFHGGAGLLAARCDVPVVPVYLGGVFAVLPKGRSVPRPAPVQVRFGPPLYFAPGTRPGVAAAAMAAAIRHLATGVIPLPGEKGATNAGRLSA